jgi:hypothetical protein
MMMGRCGGRTGRQSCGGPEMYCAYQAGSCGLDDSEVSKAVMREAEQVHEEHNR